MKKSLLKSVVVLLVLVLIIPALPPAVRVAADGKLKGIDYDRFTQKISEQTGSYDVTLTVHDMDFKGKLSGTEGLTVEEMNEIILAQLKAMDLTLAEVEVLSTLGADLDGKVTVEMGKKLALALSAYVPVPGPGAGTVAKQLLYGNATEQDAQQDVAVSIAKDSLEKAAKESRKKIAIAHLKAGTVPKHAAVRLGMVGFALSSVEAGVELADTTQFDEFCRKMEKQFEKIGAFYAICSQKMNDKVAAKNTGRCRITFENAVAETKCVFLGVDGVRLKYTLNGELVREVSSEADYDPYDNSGKYEGDLTLTVEGLDLATDFDAVFADKSDIWTYGQRINDWCQILYKFEGMPNARKDNLDKFIFTVNKPTVLKRTLIGRFTVNVTSWKTGTVKPGLSGAFNNRGDSTEFRFAMNFGQEVKTDQMVEQNGWIRNLGHPVMQWHVISNGIDLSTFHVTWVGNEAARYYAGGASVGKEMYSGDGQDMVITKRDLGTVWYALEFAPEMKINVPTIKRGS
ncbi:MAG: hypothetical protein J5830_01290 [Clostridia bacterium]|nr:hypothetical protein [Clostridia bacterium]